ncbi:hypothetical protein [Capnocytophaga sputigena]|uniref:hypothetical protein n=1 Tax=Capnocytophaga sputigena TaxID=1019 RepID=UPI0028EAAE1B|nr:hypothetical protein [Capnocytophaga sputigena]
MPKVLIASAATPLAKFFISIFPTPFQEPRELLSLSENYHHPTTRATPTTHKSPVQLAPPFS